VHAFRRLSRPAQWAAAVLLAALCFGILGALVALPLLNWRWIPLLLLILPLIAPLESLLLTPFYVLTGRFRYYSPLLFATRRRDGGLDLHVGTLFDYVMRLRWSDRGPRAARIVMADLLRGLLALCREVEHEELRADAPLVATSYFFSERSLARLGFELDRPPRATVQNLFLTSLSIAIRLSFTRGRPSFPDLRRIRQAATSAGRLVHHQAELRRLLERLPPVRVAG
jgi:MFS family permease